MNLDKSRVWFSPNMPLGTKQQISSELEIPQTKDLRLYLGVPLIHKRVGSQDYGHLVDKMNTWLNGWKQRLLSRAAKLVLIQSVSNVIPAYSMNSCVLQMKTLRQLKRINKSFLWDDKDCMQGIHPVSWETICKPKGEGGLDLHSLTHTNQVLLAKTT